MLLGLGGFKDFIAHLVDSRSKLTDQLIFLTYLREKTLYLFKSSATDELIKSLPHLPDTFFELKLPVFAHQSEFLFESLGSNLRGLDVPM